MNKGLYQILRKIAENPQDQQLEKRYLSLIADLEQVPKVDAVLDLSHLIAESKPKRALELVRDVDTSIADHTKKRATKIVQLAMTKLATKNQPAKKSSELGVKVQTKVTVGPSEAQFNKDNYTMTKSKAKKSVFELNDAFQKQIDANNEKTGIEREQEKKELGTLEEVFKTNSYSEVKANPTDLELRNVPSMIGETDKAINSVNVNKSYADHSQNAVDTSAEPGLDVTNVNYKNSEPTEVLTSNEEAKVSSQQNKPLKQKKAKKKSIKAKENIASQHFSPETDLSSKINILKTTFSEEIVSTLENDKAAKTEVAKDDFVESTKSIDAIDEIHCDYKGLDKPNQTAADWLSKYKNIRVDVVTLCRLVEGQGWNADFIEGLIDELWGLHVDKFTRELLVHLKATHKSSALWGIYLQTLMSEQMYRQALQEIYAFASEDMSLESCKVAFEYLNDLSHILYFECFQWKPKLGKSVFLHKLEKRLKPSVIAIAA